MIDKIIHEPARLKIMIVLLTVQSCDFTFLLRQTSLTRGNLSTHLRKIEQAGYISITKKFVEKVPSTMISLTSAGRKALRVYRCEMHDMLAQMEV